MAFVTCNEETEVDIKCFDNGINQIFSFAFHVPSIFNGYIIGKRGATKQRIENESNTSIFVPRQEEAGNLEIRGKTKDGVMAAYIVIKNIVAVARSKHSYNYFISIPMVNVEVMENFRQFKEKVLQNCGDCLGVHEDLFSNPVRLHLTAGVMMLADDHEKELAVSTLIASKEDILSPLFQGNSLKVRVRGIKIMDNTPEEAKIIYAKIEDPSDGLLQKFMDDMVDYFVKAGLMKKERAHVTLHMTLLNSYFLMKKLYGDTIPKGIKYHRFDACKILELYEDYDFGSVEINEIHLSESRSATEENYYAAFCKIMFK